MHRPVLFEEVMAYLAPRAGGQYIDATVNGGGHAAGVLERSSPDGRLLGLDADPEALARARQRLSAYGARVRLIHANFRTLGLVARAEGFEPAAGVLFDLGLSSDTLERSGRGFSFQRDEPLDMRYDPTTGATVAQLLATSSERELYQLLRAYGEEPRAARVARAIVEARARAPLRTTGQLVAVIERALGPARGRIHPATRIFQALRIAVNDELASLQLALAQAVELLARGGRLVVIAFHSLEDRVVKQFLRAESGGVCRCPPLLPVCACGRPPRLAVLTRKPVVPSTAEVTANPRARSAKLRAAERV
ncbi:MAG TPA: 16S rRNA (cytosine(1402)-N(4))-methyltransferase RsmH [Chloroflexota bacterium]|nr:16S rRNA (cytosine(1402)-N(4))-methyltransferase RsmH [Chloroflexota bacterium]